MDHELNLKERYAAERRKRAMFRLLEMYMWFFVSVAIAGRVIFISVSENYGVEIVLRDYYWDAIIGGLFLVFPIFFKLIFGTLPLETLRFNRMRQTHPFTVNIEKEYSFGPPTKASVETRDVDGVIAASSLTGRDLLLNQAADSRNLAKGIYGRSGVYLLVGVLVAFSGLAFFYSQTVGLTLPTDPNVLFFSLIPKFGMLFFIEFVAFFFLRQYRSAMDEFRYYEAVARKREEVSALLGIAKDTGATIELMELVKNDSFFSKNSILNKDQTTEIIEARRMEKGEIELLEKVVDTLAKAKK